MARNGTNTAAETPPRPEVARVTEGAIASLDKLSKELAARFPDRFIQRFVMPSNVRECREILLMEITSRDEITAAAMADAMMSKQERESYKLALDAEKRECVRLSIVALGERQGGYRAPVTAPVVYRHVNVNGLPFVEINDWSGKAWASLHSFFGQLNGVPMDEIRSGIEGAQTVGAFAPPQTNETPASAAAEK